MTSEKMIYTETQRFRQWWIWVLMTGVTLMVLYGAYIQLITGVKWGNNPAPDGFLVGTVVFILAIDAFLYSIKLQVKVSNKAIYFRLFPFHIKFKKIDWSAIQTAEVVVYKPLIEYGGWGIRYSWKNKGMAYTTSGKNGLQIKLKKGKRVLLGTSRPGLLKAALSEINQMRDLASLDKNI